MFGVWRAYPKASRLGQIVPRRGFPEEDSLVLDNACQGPLFDQVIADLKELEDRVNSSTRYGDLGSALNRTVAKPCQNSLCWACWG